MIFSLIFIFQEYIQDGIEWARVDFDDNQDCLSLFEKVNLLYFFYHALALNFLFFSYNFSKDVKDKFGQLRFALSHNSCFPENIIILY